MPSRPLCRCHRRNRRMPQPSRSPLHTANPTHVAATSRSPHCTRPNHTCCLGSSMNLSSPGALLLHGSPLKSTPGQGLTPLLRCRWQDPMGWLLRTSLPRIYEPPVGGHGWRLQFSTSGLCDLLLPQNHALLYDGQTKTTTSEATAVLSPLPDLYESSQYPSICARLSSAQHQRIKKIFDQDSQCR